MKVFSKIFTAIVYLFDFAIILIAVAYFALRLMGINSYVVMSGSMEPLIHTGARAFIDNKDLDVGIDDVVEFETMKADGSPAFVVHRIVGVNEDGTWITKGDANDVIDMHAVPQSAIRGKYKFQIPKMGYIPTMGFVMIIIVLVGLNVMSWLIDKSAEALEEETEELRL